MRATSFHLFFVSIIGLSTSCAPEPKGSDTTKDSGARNSDSTVTDLNTDELTNDDILQIAFSFNGVDYFNQWWTDETYSRTERINDNAQPGDILLYMDLTDYTPGSGTWSVTDVQAGTTHPLFEITASDSAYPRLSIRELDATSGAIGDHGSLTSLGQGDETYNHIVSYWFSGTVAYCKTITSGTSDNDRICGDCVELDGSDYTDPLGRSQGFGYYCYDNQISKFGARVNYNDGSTDYEQVTWWDVDSLQAPTITNLANVNDGVSGGLTYSDSEESTILAVEGDSPDADYTEDGSQGLQFNDDAWRTSSLRVRLYGCTTSDFVYVRDGMEWEVSGSSEEKLKFNSLDEIRVAYSPSLATDAIWDSSNLITTYPVWNTPLSNDSGSYCEILFQFRDNADSNITASSGLFTSVDHVTGLLRSLTYRYADTGSGIVNEGLRTLQVVLRDEDNNPAFAMASQPQEIDIAVYNNPVLTDSTTATVFDGTPDLTLSVDYDAELTVGGTDADGDPCFTATTTLVKDTLTTVTFSKANGSDLSEGTHTCTLTPVRTVTPTRVTDGETTSFDFTGDVQTFSMTVDTTAPTISITQIADSNGYTTSVTPTFDVTTDESGTLVLGGSCTTSDSTSLSSGTTTITLDTLTEGTAYSDCTVTVTDIAGNDSATENLIAFTPDATAPTVTIDTQVANSNGYTTSVTPTFDVTTNESGTLTVGGSCSITNQNSISANTSTTITLDTVTEGTTYSDCTVTVTDIAGNAGTASLTSFTPDATAPTISITQIADSNGYTTSVTPTFDVTTTEDGTLVLGGSCTTSDSTALSSGTTTITLDTLTEGTTYSDCTVTVTDDAGLSSTSESLASFTPDVTAPSLTVSLASPLSSNASVTEDTTPDLTIVLASTESDTTISVDVASTNDCALSTSTLTGGAASNTVTFTHPTTTDFSDSLVTCEVDLVDSAGNTADATISFYVDTTAPTVTIDSQPATPTSEPTFGLDTDEAGTLSLTGDCANGTIGVSGSSSISDTSSGAAAQVSITGLTEATYYTCAVVVTDVAGRTGSADLDTFSVDTTSDAPVITGIANDTGLSSTDLITNDPAVGVVGTAEANAEVTVTIDDGSSTVTCVVTADGNGDWTCDSTTDTSSGYTADLGSAGSSVDYTVTATAIDALSNAASSTSNSLTITVDQEAPALSVGVVGNAGEADTSNPTVTLTSDQAVDSIFQLGTNSGDDCAAASYTETADTTSGNTFTMTHGTTGGFADNTAGTPYSCSATVTDVAGNVSTEENFTFDVALTGFVISQSAAADSSAGSGSVTSNTAPVVQIYSNTAVDTSVAGSISLTGGCETTVSTIAANATTDITLTASGGGAFSDGSYTCVLTVSDGTTSKQLTLDSFTVDSTAPTIAVTDTNANTTTSISFAEDTTIGSTIATVTGTDAFATTISYSEDATGDASANAALEIDSATGVVSLSTPATNGTTYSYTVVVSDDALPTNNQATETITFTVTEANVAPALDNALVANFSNISEHIVDGDNTGQTVSTLLTDGTSSAISDTNVSSSEGIAIYGYTAETGSEWQYKDATGNWTTLPSVSGTSVFLLTPADELRYVPSVTNGETGTLSFYAWDQTDGTQFGTETVTARGSATAYSTEDATVSIVVDDANDPPTMTASTTVTLTAINEGDTSDTLLNSEVSSLIGDVDTASALATLGIAVTGFVEDESGSWQYSTDGGSTWSNFSDLASVSETSALLLGASDSNGRVRFVSNTSNGETATLTFYAWDQSAGSIGSQVDITAVYGDVDSAYSASGSANTFSLTVNDVNDAPVLADSVADFASINEDEVTNDGDLVSALLNSSLSDVDTVSSQGIAIHTANLGNGSWEYSSDASTWTAFPSVSTTNALVLTDTDSVRFVPSNDNADTGSIAYFGWDQSDASSTGDTVDVSTTGGTTAFSVDSRTSSITVNDINDQPVLDTTTSPIALTAIDEGDSDSINYSASVSISSTIGSTITDGDSGDSKGIAITDASSSNGYWEYSVDNETTWTEITGVSSTSALLLDESAFLRFASTGPDGVTATLTFYAWDQTNANPDTTAVFTPSTTSPFSVDSNSLSLLVNDLNDAPVLGGVTTDLGSITENDADNSEADVSTFELSTLISTNSLITDTDTTALFSNTGIAVTGVSNTNGRWDYSIDNESTWTEITGVSSTSVLVLDESAFVRFVPDSTNGTTATLTFLAWDGSDSASNGSSVSITSANQGNDQPYSLNEDTLSLTVTDENDQPVLDTTTSPIELTAIDEGDSDSINYSASVSISSTIGSTITESDSGDPKGIAITDASSSNGYWEYSVDNETTWTEITGVSSTSALLLDESAFLRFASTGPDGVTATLTFYAWDQTNANPDTTAVFTPSTTSPFSVDSNSLSLLVNDLNDAPVLGGVTTDLGSITENDADSSESDVSTFELSTLISTNSLITDTDTTALFSNTGIAVTGVSNTNGRWDYSIDNESTWTEITGVSSTSVLVLDESAFVRFVPDSTNGTTATLTFLAWDGSDSASNGSSVSITSANQGNDQPYSLNEDTLSLTVTDENDQPVFTNTTEVVLTPEISEGEVSAGFNLFVVLDPSSDVSDVDDPTLSNIGVAISSASTTEGEWEYSEDAGTTWTSIPTVSTSDALLLDMSTMAGSAQVRFNATTGDNGTTATLQVYAWDKTQSPSPADVATQNTTDGLTSPFSSMTRDISLVVNAVNDQPVLDTTTSPIVLTAIDEGDSDSINYSASVSISSTIASTITESDSGDSKGIAITDASSSNGYWEYSVDNESTWTEITGVSSTSAWLLDESAFLRFASTGPDGVTATLTFYAWDQTNSNPDTTAVFTPSTTSPFSVDSNSLSLLVNDLNDAPELVAGASIDLGSITEDDAPSADAPTYSGLTTYQISSLVTSSVYTDTDTTAAFNNTGIALIDASTTNGRWEYSQDAAVTWTTVPAVSSTLILPLDGDDFLRFVPNGQNGTSATLQFVGWDQSNNPTLSSDNTTTLTSAEQGDAGAYSINSNTFSLTVDSINDAPVFSTTGTTILTAITENDVDNAGQLISEIVGGRVTDVDSGAVYGIAITSIASGVGTWEFNLNDGTGWQSVEDSATITASNARLLGSTATLRFNPNVAMENGEATDPTIEYVIWDQSTGSNGGLTSVATTGDTTPYSINSEVASISVSDVNDAPVIASVTDFATITEDNNQSSVTEFAQISSLISVTDVDTVAPNDGIAIVSQTATNGVWKYSLDGVTWGTVSLASGALVLDLDDYLAFIPDGNNGGTSDLEFYAWDQYSDTTAPTPGSNTAISATGNDAPFSATTDTISILVSEVNDAPVWPAGTSGGAFTAITENQTNNSGDAVSDLLNSQNSDNDSGADQGIAVFAFNLGSNGTGTWEYSTDSRTSWTAMPSVSTTSALLLRASDYVRFVPDGDNGESTNPYIDFFVWDGNPSLFGTVADASIRGGTDGTANFSENSGRSEIEVSDVNDAPSITAFGMVYDEGESTVQLNTTDVVGNNADISLTEVDIGDTLTVTLQLAAANWPYDAAAPSGGARTFVENNQFVTLDVTDVYGGTLDTSSTTWSTTTNSLTLTGSVASINAELQTLVFTPTAGLTPTDSASAGVPDFDLNTTITMSVTDTSSAADIKQIALDVQNAQNDKPIAIAYWDAYEDLQAAESEDQSKLVTELDPNSPSNGVYIRVESDLSWDPDNLDDVVSITFTPSEPITANCGGTTSLLTSTSGCTLTDGTTHLTHPARPADITWTVSVTDNDGQSNSVADLHDQTTVSIANQPPEVGLFFADEVFECTRAHATATNNPVYADEDLDCFCDRSACDTNQATCVDSDGVEGCEPTLSTTFTECAPLPAVYGDDNRGTDTGCYCEEMDCDGFNADGEENCFDADGLACLPATNTIDACVPTVSPDDFDFPYDVNLELIACTYDINGDALNFNWSLATAPSLGTASLTVDGNRAVLSIDPPVINGTVAYFQDDTLDLQLEVADLEDTTTVLSDMNFCAGWFPDNDEDGYGATNAYQANCADTVSATFSAPIPANSNISVVQGSDYLGLDCLDEGTISDDASLYGDLASTVALNAIDVQDTVNWYIDYDGDGYGAMLGGRGDNGSGQYALTDGAGAVTDTIDIVYQDAVHACILENPSVTLSTGEVRNYLLNDDDCNDVLDFTDGVYAENPATGGLGASNQNPETTWYADIDGDGFAIGTSTDTSANFVYPDADFDCLCTSASGSCSSIVNNYEVVKGVTSTTCVKTGSLYSYKVKYQQCESPTEDPSTQGISGLPISWTLQNSSGFGDCDETDSRINEGAQEACDELDVDEDCDGLADDNDTNGSVSGALTFFVDNDGDGSPTSVGKVFSCDGNSSSGASSLVYYYTLSNSNTTFLDATVSGQCICPTDKCNEACRLSTDPTKTCVPTDDTAYTNGTSYCAGVTSNGNFNYNKTPFDFTASSFSDFALYVRDCDDTSGAVYPRADEACDGVLNDCVNSADGVPTDEVDFDNDGYVECEFDGSTWNGANTPLVGADCSPRDTNVFPNAPNICDGQYNNCDSWRPTYVDSARECFCYDVDATDGSLCNPTTCVDIDGASCTPSFDVNGSQTCQVWSAVDERYRDETGSCFCDETDSSNSCASDVCHTAEGAVCTPSDVDGDGLTTCTLVEFDNRMSPGAPANQVDNDGDCYVECFDGSTSFVGGTALLGDSCSTIIEGQDCNDTSSFVYPGAIEVCDGQFNNCNSPSFSATGAPVNETDDDGDGYVECNDGEYMDLSGCRCLSATDDGTGTLTYNDCTNSRGQVCVPNSTVAAVTWVTGTTGYGDCADLDDTRYPTAPEICDGIFNDCENPLLDAFVGASGEDCFCQDEFGSVCVDSAGASCSIDVNVVDVVELTTPAVIDSLDYAFQEVECYCSTSDCQIDVDGDGATDCLDENANPCQPVDANNDGFADSCIEEPLNATTGSALSQVMYGLTNAPGREADNDGDGYVECNYTSSIWVGSAYVVGGSDCNDFPTNNGDRVYPTAPEYCDGIFNDCENPIYSALSAPSTESDIDGDGYVECALTAGFDWVGEVNPDGYEDCVDSNSLIYPNAAEVCDGVFNNCLATGYAVDSAPDAEVDNDEDGFVECADVYFADATGCVCEQGLNAFGVQDFINCTYKQQVCTPDLTTLTPITWVGPEIDGYEDCDDAVDTVYPTASEVCDGRFNDCNDPLKPDGDNAGVYSGVVGDCFCATVDSTGDGRADACDATDCFDAAGTACTPDDEDMDGYVDNCIIGESSPFYTDGTGSTYYGANIDCYCPTEDCQLDVTGDAITDCYAPNGSECFAASDSSGFAEACLSNLNGTRVNVSHIFLDDSNAQIDQPWKEIDNDGDGYVECEEFDLSTYRAGGGSFSVVGGLDCDDYDQRVYPTAPEFCDGQFNNCEDVAYTATGAPETEVDGDGDGYVECTLTNGVPWAVPSTDPTGAGLHYADDYGCYCDGPCDNANSTCRDYSGAVCVPVVSTCQSIGGYGDCDDTDKWVFPTAPDLCDGQYNDCDNVNFSLVNVPVDESDADEDGYVACFEDGSVWSGDTPPTGYGDCEDDDPTTSGSAVEICDGLFNDCAHPQKFPFEGVVGDCYCPSSDCMIDNGQGSECVDSSGATCYPEDADGDNRADYCNESVTPVTIAGNDFYGVEVECYCPSSDCLLDTTGDGAVDCLTPTGDVCSVDNDGNGYAATCAYGSQVPHQFTQANGLPLSAPMNETDHDGDGYVECEFFAATWEGPLSVDGGLDCNDGDDLVFPGATEYCDGQYNNCSDLTYDFDGAPATESDIDNDGYVACSLTAGVEWSRESLPIGDEDCNDNDGTVYPGAVEVCDGQYNNCSIFGYDANGAPADETDNDGDGYVECSDGGFVDANGCACAFGQDTTGDGFPDTFGECVDSSGTVCTPQIDSLVEVIWAGNSTPVGYGDCQDANAAQYPNALEECDGIFNNCEHPQKSAFEGVVSDCLCPTADVDGDGSDDVCLASGCFDTTGASCAPVDENQDGYVDDAYCAISTTPENQTGYGFYGAEVDCYCPSSDCQLDVLGNGTSDCVTPTGEVCIPSDALSVGYADECMTGSRGLTVEHTFVNSNGGNLTRPFNETDNDGDGYVECEYISATWLGSFSVVGGLDCDDTDTAVYPSALEVCDGQYNNCSNNYVATSAPANELDDDGDGWVECVRDLDVAWNAFDGSEEPNAMGYGTDGTLSGTSYCICSDSSCSSNCMDAAGNSCSVPAGFCERQVTYEYSDCDDADEYTHPFVALNEYSEAGDGVGVSSCLRDRDGDGYGDAAPTNADVTAGHDCDDLNLYVHPKQNEICEVGDQVDSDCNGNVNTAVYSEGYILDTNGQGTLLYVDNDGDGFGDSDIAATPACEVAEGFVFNATDCNDEDSTINPNSKEICDGIDQDCDLTIDEADSLDDPSISKCTFMYRDVDADSYGDADYAACLCQEGSNPSVTYGEYEYVIYAGDCYDYNADIKPLSCADGIDQDDDGFVDGEDPNCIAGFKEGSDTVKEEAFELLDGHDNNCDGLVAAVELDCDDDGSYPLVPGESAGFNRSNKFKMAADIGLEACSGLSANLECWGEQQRLVCDSLTAEINNGAIEYNGTGLWMLSINESDDGFGGRFDGGHREYPMGRECGASRGDCDDQCADRCPDQTETCDGLDNDCSNTSPGTDGESGDGFKGIPDAMIPESPIAGTISDAEIDIDSDGYLSCDDFTSSGAQSQWSDASCDTVSGVSDDNDCNNFCFFSSPNAEERCDAFQGVCDGENLDGTDADSDDMLTCGTWGTDETLTEDIYMVVWMKDVDWSQLASEEQELIRPVRSSEDIALVLEEMEAMEAMNAMDTADTAYIGDTGDTAYEGTISLQETESERLLRKRREFITERLPILNTNGGLIAGDVDPELLERMVPLVSPRALAPYCDSYLQDQLTLLLGFDNMEALRQTTDPEEQADILLQACDSSIDGVAGCGIVRLSLSRTTDDETYEFLDAIQGDILSFPTECEERTEEWISRSMWQRERIVEARTITVEWECRRMYGQACDEISAQTRLLNGWEESMISPERWLDVDRAWFKEIGRYNPEAIDGGTMMSCWGDPTDPTAKFNEEVGGDCSDSDPDAHRDNPEGPGDLVGLYLYGDMADCDTCLDGIDNNCDGAIDCADPACAPCFVGQGVGCGGGEESPCAQGGCASPDQSGKERMYRSFGLIMMAMIISIIRRREKRSAA